MKKQRIIYLIYIFQLIMIFSCTNSQVSETASSVEIDSIASNPGAILLGNSPEYQTQICTELLPPPPPQFKIQYVSDTSIFFRNKTSNDTFIFNEIKSKNKPIYRGAILKDYYWDKLDLTVSFLDGDPYVQKKVIETAKKWENYCGIRFNFGNFPNPDISISFRYEGSWSYIGSYSQKVRPSMNFGWLYRNTDEREYDRVVLHEFGHALGFIHEHNHPDVEIPWNRAKVYTYYMGPPNNWDKNTVDQNIFQKYNRSQVNATAFDNLSIMLYTVPSDLTDGKYSTPPNYKISRLDSLLVSRIYPKR